MSVLNDCGGDAGKESDRKGVGMFCDSRDDFWDERDGPVRQDVCLSFRHLQGRP